MNCDIQVLNTSIDIKWENICSAFSFCTTDMLWNIQSDNERIESILLIYERIILEHTHEPSILEDHIRCTLIEIYWYYRCISEKGYDLTWKHAKRFFYSHWNNDKKNIIEMCVISKYEWDLYQLRIKELIYIGIDPIRAKNDAIPDGIRRDAIIRYSLLLQFLQFCNRSIEDDIMRWRFKRSIREDEKFTLLMKKFERKFSSNIINTDNSQEELWMKISSILENQFCIIHEINDNDTCISISFDKDGTLI